MNAGILSGNAIAAAVADGDIQIDPFNRKQLNPASYDVTLGDEVCVYTDQVYVEEIDVFRGSDYRGNEIVLLDSIAAPSLLHGYVPSGNGVLDAKKKNPTKTVKMSRDGFLLKPGIGYLLHTAERIKTDVFVPIIDGKSSIGRLFITVHVTAGYGDPGFDGQYTLETVVTHPVIIYPGMRFGQVRFHTMLGVPDLYKEHGNYVGSDATGPVPSKSWRQFKP